MPDALPVHLVSVDAFWMDRAPVTNAEFERFVKATGYVTVAERPLDPSDFPGVPRDKLVPGSAVFIPTSTPVPLDNPLQWWRYTPAANWKHPEGPGSSLSKYPPAEPGALHGGPSKGPNGNNGQLPPLGHGAQQD